MELSIPPAGTPNYGEKGENLRVNIFQEKRDAQGKIPNTIRTEACGE